MMSTEQAKEDLAHQTNNENHISMHSLVLGFTPKPHMQFSSS